jgi:hypothetical protein
MNWGASEKEDVHMSSGNNNGGSRSGGSSNDNDGDMHAFTLVTKINKINNIPAQHNIDLDRSLMRPQSMIPDEPVITTHVHITSHEVDIMFRSNYNI